jgi:hypothetical protein
LYSWPWCGTAVCSPAAVCDQYTAVEPPPFCIRLHDPQCNPFASPLLTATPTSSATRVYPEEISVLIGFRFFSPARWSPLRRLLLSPACQCSLSTLPLALAVVLSFASLAPAQHWTIIPWHASNVQHVFLRTATSYHSPANLNRELMAPSSTDVCCVNLYSSSHFPACRTPLYWE